MKSSNENLIIRYTAVFPDGEEITVPAGASKIEEDHRKFEGISEDLLPPVKFTSARYPLAEAISGAIADVVGAQAIQHRLGGMFV